MPRPAPPAFSGQSLDALEAALAALGPGAPVERWNPGHCGDSEMRIARDGRWFHQGRPITRPAMVQLFATVLRREPDGSHVLVTPVEKLSIEVERTAFRALEMTSEGKGRARRLAFRLDSGDIVIAGPEHPLGVTAMDDGPSPRLLVRHGLEAELARSLYYELADIALGEGHEPPGVWSNGAFFSLTPAP